MGSREGFEVLEAADGTVRARDAAPASHGPGAAGPAHAAPQWPRGAAQRAQLGSSSQIALMSGGATVEDAVEAIKLGASRVFRQAPRYAARPRADGGDAAAVPGPHQRARRRCHARRAARSVRDDRPLAGDARVVQRDQPSGAACAHRPDHRRHRHRQRAGGARAAPARSAQEQEDGHGELFGGGRDVVRVGAVRPRTRRVHRRQCRQDRGVRSGQRRHRVPRRSRRAARLAPRRNYCAPSRTGKCSASARSSSARSTSA